MRTLILLLAGLLLAAPAVGAQTTDSQALTLSPGDIIRVQIYQEPEISGEYPVDEEGRVVLPLIGEKRVTGIPIRRLREMLLEDFRAHLRNPSILITPLRRVNVLGEVNKPGLYPIDPTVTLAGAIALAGGANPTGDLRRVRIVRDGQIIRERVGVAETLSAADIRSNDQIIVERRSWFERNSTFVVSTLISVTSIVIALLN